MEQEKDKREVLFDDEILSRHQKTDKDEEEAAKMARIKDNPKLIKK